MPANLHTTPSTLSLCTFLNGSTRRLDGDWKIMPAHQGSGIEAGFADPTFDDSAWETVQLPHLQHSTTDRDTLWYRHRFVVEAPAEGRRLLLCVGGAFYHTRVWLNGVHLGAHEGYFQPFGFDITDCVQPGENVLAIQCRFPVEAHSFKRKTAIVGIFADWDCKPYPSTVYPELPPPHEWSVPVGLWQPVCLRTSGPILIESVNVFPAVTQMQGPLPARRAAAAKLRVVVGLRNLTAEPQHAAVRVTVEPHNFKQAGHSVSEAGSVTLAGGEQHRLELALTLPEPRLWLPWTHGEPWLYRATVQVGATGDEVTQVFGVREVRAVIEPDRWEWWLNGAQIFPKGSNYVSDFYLDRVTPDGLRRDIELARQANLDILRVHAHIAPPAFYRLCDELGMLVMCDFPMIWTYGFNLPPAEDVAFQLSAVRQAGEMVDLLGSHPSIVLWSMHNEPPWTPDGSFLGSDVHQAATNRELDHAMAARVCALDPTRPVIPASGERDQHLYHGWYTGSWRDNRDLAPTFPTEFGVQALPNLESPVWATVNTEWPVPDDDPSWAHAGYQSLFWASPGVGLPSQFASLADYVAESQAYQAFYIRYVIDQWRRKKFQPTGGYIHFLFTDGWPAITWSVLDYARLPKAGYQALAAASRPVRLALDLEDGYQVERSFHLVYPEGGRLRVGLYLVNDDFRRQGEVVVRWWLERRDGGKRWNFLRRRWRVQALPVALPAADAGALHVQTLDIPLFASGAYTLRTQVRQGRQVLDENWIDFRVGEKKVQRRPPRRVPGLLLRKVYQAGSLRHTGDGFSFGLYNPAMPITLERLTELRVDGVVVDPAQIELVCGGVARRVSTITPQAPFEVPSRERLTVVVREFPLGPGRHQIDVTGEFFGFGEVSARIRDKLV